jgi:L-fuconolactonase
MSPWRENLSALAKFDNVCCKLSGMATEAGAAEAETTQAGAAEAETTQVGTTGAEATQAGVIDAAGIKSGAAGWTAHQLAPYADVAIEAFGPRRLMFGSDWPVCLLATDYRRWVQTVRSFIAALSADEQAWIMGRAAMAAYRL